MRQPATPQTILVADDTPSVRRLIVRLCETNGYRVVEASDGDHALQLAESRSAAINLLVTDVDMPGLNGLALATKLRLMLPQLPVCFVSGRELPAGALAAAEKSGRTVFLMKPVDLAELLLAIRTLLRDQGVREGSRRPYCTDEGSAEHIRDPGVGRSHQLSYSPSGRLVERPGRRQV